MFMVDPPTLRCVSSPRSECVFITVLLETVESCPRNGDLDLAIFGALQMSWWHGGCDLQLGAAKKTGILVGISYGYKWYMMIYGYILYMGVSINRDTPTSSIYIGLTIINHPFWGISIYGNRHITKQIHFPWSLEDGKPCASYFRPPL